MSYNMMPKYQASGENTCVIKKQARKRKGREECVWVTTSVLVVEDETEKIPTLRQADK